MTNRLSLFLAAGSVLITAPSTAHPVQHKPAERPQNPNLRRFLRTFMYDPELPKDEIVRFSAARVPGTDLTVVYISGRYVCGTGGCSILVLRPAGNSFRNLSDSPALFSPVTILKTRHKGLPDLGVWCRCATSPKWGTYGYQAALRFDGRRYKLDAAARLARDTHYVKGKILISQDDPGTPLF